MDTRIRELNREIQTYKELIYELAKLPGGYALMVEFMEKRFIETMEMNRDIMRTTDIATFLRNAIKDNEAK